MSRGFTLIEILVTIVIMVILLTLAVANLRSTQIQARDTERRNDVESIARGLEQRYNLGNTKATLPTGWTNKGSYPGNNEILHMMGCDRAAQGFVPGQISGGYLTEGLPGITDKILNAPGNETAQWVCAGSAISSLHPSCVWACANAETQSQIESSLPSGQFSRYIYEPYSLSGSNKIICANDGCRGFNLYWRSEVDNSIQVTKSKWR